MYPTTNLVKKPFGNSDYNIINFNNKQSNNKPQYDQYDEIIKSKLPNKENHQFPIREYIRSQCKF